jgi:hypothetical protein
MPNAIIERDHLWFHHGVEKLKAEVVVLEDGLADMEQQNLRSSPLVQKLGHLFGFGVAGKLEWARFKLNFKQEELAQFRVQEMSEVMATGPAGETTRQKMARMIAENPPELEPELRRVYQSMIDAGK